jgi:hypothetical protein
MNTHATIEELLDASFFIRSLSYQMRVCGSVHLFIVARQRLGKHFHVARRNWKRHFLCDPCRIKGKYAISSAQNFFLIHELAIFSSLQKVLYVQFRFYTYFTMYTACIQEDTYESIRVITANLYSW